MTAISLLGLVTDVLGAHAHLVEARRVGQPAVVAGGESTRTPAVAADPDRNLPRAERARPELADQLEAVLQQLPAAVPVEALAERLELLAVAAETRAEDGAAARQLVEGGDLDREHLWPAPRNRRHARSEQQALRAHRDGAERDPGIDRRPVPDPRQVIPQEQRLPACLLRGFREPDDVLRLRERADVRCNEPESHQQQV